MDHATIENSINVINGNKDNVLSYWLKKSITRANKIDIIVSFIMESGVKILINDLKDAIGRGIEINILTGNYLNITQPQALYLIRAELGEKVNLRFYSDHSKSFHPKAYIFQYDNGGEVYIGSSNISRGALTNSVEWNYRLSKEGNEEDFLVFLESFNDLWNNHSYDINNEVLKNYSRTWVRPNIYKYVFDDEKYNVNNIVEPRGAQIEALYELKKTREEGFDKALVIASTGIGKTYLAAFDSRDFSRVLFVAHREEIIKQARDSFSLISPEKTTGLFFSDEKEANRDNLFALVNTIGKEEYLNEDYFKIDQFDYIVIDEFHHAAANSYKRVLDYFKPKFLLGLTATPERMDNKDVFELCDYNVVYELRLKEAINRGELVSFNYYGIHDNTVNYDEIEFKYGRYNDQELEVALQIHKRADLIIKNYNKYKSTSALGFCSSKAHAEYMAKYFNENGISSVSVYSGEQGEYTEERDRAISQLKNKKIRVIFSVDMFNEGLDIPSIDLVMFLRPTQSSTIFLQQLGRGLRKSKGKEKLTVIDFIGNYKKANIIPFLLSGKIYSKNEIIRGSVLDFEYPEDCHVDFDLTVIDIFKELSTREISIANRIKQEYYRIKDIVGRVPTRTELFVHMEDEIYSLARRNTNKNPLRNYLKYLSEIGELNDEETKILNSLAGDFISMIEKTSMSKTYKMPILLAFYNEGSFKLEIDEDDVYKSFKKFYSIPTNAVDMLRDLSTKDFVSWEKEQYVNLAKRNPIKFLVQTESIYFYINEKGNMCINRDLASLEKNRIFINHLKDVITFRTKEFYKNRLEKN